MREQNNDNIKQPLELRQRDFLATFFEKAALMILGALVIGQLITFLQDKLINWWVFAGSLFMIYVLMKKAVILKRPD